MEEICIVSTNAETNHHIGTNSKLHCTHALNNVSYLVCVCSVALCYRRSDSGSCGLGRIADLEGEACSEVFSCGCGCVCVPPFKTQWNLLALGDAASFSFPVAKLMRNSSPLFGEQCCLASNSGSEHGIVGLMGSMDIQFKNWHSLF